MVLKFFCSHIVKKWMNGLFLLYLGICSGSEESSHGYNQHEWTFLPVPRSADGAGAWCQQDNKRPNYG